MVEGDEEQKKGAKVAKWKGCAYMCTVLGLGQERVYLYVRGPGL